jgi:hypothetical protein
MEWAMIHDHHDHPHEEPSTGRVSVTAAKLAAIVEVLITTRRKVFGLSIVAIAAALMPEHAHGFVSQENQQLNKIVKLLDMESPGFAREVSLVMEANEANIGAHYGAELIDYQLIAVQNTDAVHNLIVCTPCSCYPIEVLGLTPEWYKVAEYRSNAVSNPRILLTQFGTNIPAAVAIETWDSDRNRRYLVIPQRPTGTVGWTETQLAALVTRDVMVGTAVIPPQ